MTRAHPILRRDSWGDGAPLFASRSTPRERCRSFATHQYAAVAFCVGGRSRIEQRERWTLEAGDVLIIPSGQPHRWLELQRPEWWTLGFCVPCFAGDEAGSLLEPFERVREGASAVVSVPRERHAFLETLFQELSAATDPQRPIAVPAVQRSLLTLVLNEVRAAARWVDASPGHASVVVESLRFIERNCLGPLTLKDVARAVGRNPAYVTSALSRATGRSAVAWIIAGRLAQARRLLLHSDERIDVIAERVGYADATHLIRLFRREHGATPAAWRAARRRPALSV